ncbi:uncharacterized protein LAESUDRAFT_179335 [Laetiporus sulphureus 93-53]|uniref:Uncharacterized protein n=1 Tax=Laetiporus sulphureus 93-53 TaxID=1314785 RepID=A0A165E8F4_9APHY|nr:uncharacterized protein LAESUDRAFT_179335 [Laetiporus sulphureus 93-53]KZT06454.1 hypothetical protein LAESUDRAFT_179335 [Laetiporus sulphureus 93-53]
MLSGGKVPPIYMTRRDVFCADHDQECWVDIVMFDHLQMSASLSERCCACEWWRWDQVIYPTSAGGSLKREEEFLVVCRLVIWDSRNVVVCFRLCAKFGLTCTTMELDPNYVMPPADKVGATGVVIADADAVRRHLLGLRGSAAAGCQRYRCAEPVSADPQDISKDSGDEQKSARSSCCARTEHGSDTLAATSKMQSSR